MEKHTKNKNQEVTPTLGGGACDSCGTSCTEDNGTAYDLFTVNGISLIWRCWECHNPFDYGGDE